MSAKDYTQQLRICEIGQRKPTWRHQFDLDECIAAIMDGARIDLDQLRESLGVLPLARRQLNS
jgi:hypothetical protein